MIFCCRAYYRAMNLEQSAPVVCDFGRGYFELGAFADFTPYNGSSDNGTLIFAVEFTYNLRR